MTIDPAKALAAAAADFQQDLAAADGPVYAGPGHPDERLGALLARFVAQLAERHRNDPAIVYHLQETTALDDWIESLESAADAVLGPLSGGSD